METGIYLIIVCKSIDRNGIAIEPVECQVAEVDYNQFKKDIEREEWQIYCRSTLSSKLNDIELLDNELLTEIRI